MYVQILVIGPDKTFSFPKPVKNDRHRCLLERLVMFSGSQGNCTELRSSLAVKKLRYYRTLDIAKYCAIFATVNQYKMVQ